MRQNRSRERVIWVYYRERVNKKAERNKGRTHPLRDREAEGERIFKSTCICFKAQHFESGATFRSSRVCGLITSVIVDGELREGWGIFKKGKIK